MSYLLIYCLILISCSLVVAADDVGSEFVQQIIDEENLHFGTDGRDFEPGENDDYGKQNIEQDPVDHEARRRAEQERIEQEATAQRQREIDAQFERELDKMDKDQKKIAKRQKKRDSKLVQRVLTSERKGNLYGVLGLRNLQFEIPPRQLKIGSVGFKLPGFKFTTVRNPAIKRAYRSTSKLVHPDKNRDARAAGAFVAVENAAQVLSNEKSRGEYDAQLRLERAQLRQHISKVLKGIINRVMAVLYRVYSVARKLLGPFAFPAFLLGVIII